jgi:hypothetical protein
MSLSSCTTHFFDCQFPSPNATIPKHVLSICATAL